jgi:hypothetical protein
MATVYEIKIKTVSPFVSYREDFIKKLFEKFLREHKDEFTGGKFENTEIEVKRIA